MQLQEKSMFRDAFGGLYHTKFAMETRMWQNKRSSGQKIAQHVRIKICTFCSHPLQNNIITSPKFAWNSTLPTNIMLQLRWGAII